MHLLKVALLILLASIQLVPAAQLLPAEVGPEQDSYTIAAGAETTIVVRLDNATGVYGIDVRASFDPALFEVVDADGTADGIQVEAGAFPQPDFVAANRVDPATGAIRYVITQMNPTLPATGSGVLFTVRLRGRGASGAGEFRIDQVEMSDRDGQLLPVNVSAATVEVAGSNLTGAGAQPTGVALAPTTSAAAPATATSLPTAEALATAAAVVSQPAAATQPAATAQPGAQVATPGPQSDDQGSAAAPAAPSPPGAGGDVQPTVVAAGESLAVPESSSARTEVAATGDTEPAPVDENAIPAESSRSQAVADTGVEQGSPADVPVIGEGQAVAEGTVAQSPPDSQDGDGLQWPYWLALGIVIALAGAAAVVLRRAS